MKQQSILQHIINGVQIEILNYKSDYVGIRYAKANGYYFLNNKLHITYEGGSTGKSLEDCRLILRPLSDFYESVDGVSFSNMITHGYHNSFWCENNFNIKHLMYHDFQMLVSKHADLFGLIEAGLAIDINTLKN
jgi:hypothetical protein